MLHWQMLILCGIIFLIIEIFTPVLFFLNLAIACFVTSLIALFVVSWNILVPIWFILSLLLLVYLRPLLIRTKNKDNKTGLEEKYIGKIAKVIETVNASKGVISIYNERWEARSLNGEEIPANSEVKIIKNDSLIFYVEQ